MAALHEEAQSPGGLPLEDETLGADPSAAHQAAPSEDEAAEWDDAPSHNLATAASSALRFVDEKAPFLRLYPNLVVGAGPSGAVMVPWDAPELDPEGITVEGKRLVRMLKAAGPFAELRATPERVVIQGNGRFTLQRLKVAVDVPTIPPTTGPDAAPWAEFDPSLFVLASSCSGDDKIEPPMFSGVNIGPQLVSATDRQSFFYAPLAAHAAWVGEGVTLPRNTFAGLEGTVWTCRDAAGNVFVATAHGEYRMAVPIASTWPDVQSVIDRHVAAFTVSVARGALIAALRRMKIVQSMTSSVMIHVFPDAEGVYQVELRAQDPHGTSEYVERVPAEDLQQYMETPGRFKTFVSGENLRRLAQLSPGESTVDMSFGADGARDPIGLFAPTYRVLVCAMSA